MEEWKEKYVALQRSYYGVVQMKISAMMIPDSIIDTEGLVAGDLARFAMANSYHENRRGNYVFSNEMIKGIKTQKSIERAVKDAIADNRFEVYFQPIYSIKEDKVMGAEALARLNDPKIGFISPLDFIRVAEKNGDIMEIVVEGIETEEMKEKMAEMGCDYEQGYYFSKPLPPADFVKYMEAETNKGV